MRESLGVSLDSDSISTALVDADTPRLGPIDQYRRQWSVDGGFPSVQSSARALVSAADVAIERASRSGLHPTAIGVVCERREVRDLISETLSPLAADNVVVVNGLDARLAYLRTVDALAGVSPILAFWIEGAETVIAAIDPLAGTIAAARITPSIGRPSAGAIGAPVVAAAGAQKWAPLAVVSALLALGGLLIGLLITLAPDKARTATTDRSNSETTPSVPGDEYSPDSGNPAVPVPPGQGWGGSVDVLPPLPPTLIEVLPPCDPVAPASPAVLRRSDPDLPSASTPPQAPSVDDCALTRHG